MGSWVEWVKSILQEHLQGLFGKGELVRSSGTEPEEAASRAAKINQIADSRVFPSNEEGWDECQPFFVGTSLEK